jgi:hypothetical protein
MSALLAWLALRSRGPPVDYSPPRSSTLKNIRHMLVLGTTNGWLANVLTAFAVERVDSAVAAMLRASVPLMVAVLVHFVFVEERFSGAATHRDYDRADRHPADRWARRGFRRARVLFRYSRHASGSVFLCMWHRLWPPCRHERSLGLGLWSASLRCGRCRRYFSSVRTSRRVEPASDNMATARDRRRYLLGCADSPLPASVGTCSIGAGRARSVSSASLSSPTRVGIPRRASQAARIAGHRHCRGWYCRYHHQTAIMTSFGFAVEYPQHNVPASAIDRYSVSSSPRNFANRLH